MKRISKKQVGIVLAVFLLGVGCLTMPSLVLGQVDDDNPMQFDDNHGQGGHRDDPGTTADDGLPDDKERSVPKKPSEDKNQIGGCLCAALGIGIVWVVILINKK